MAGTSLRLLIRAELGQLGVTGKNTAEKSRFDFRSWFIDFFYRLLYRTGEY